MKFRYRRYDVRPSLLYPDGTIWRPEVDLTITGPKGHQSTLAILDTGSDQTVLPRTVAERLGVELKSENSCDASGFRGDITTIVPGRIQFQIHSLSRTLVWTATVGFADFTTTDDECTLLGYGGCLEYFTVIFDGANKIFELRPNHCFPPKT